MLSLFTDKSSLTTLFEEGFVDIHNHILPGIDDGAKTFADSLKMLEAYSKYQITQIVATPHIIQGVWPNDENSITAAYNQLLSKLNDSVYSDFTIRYAAEYMMDEGFLTLVKQKALLPIKDNMVLLEMSYFNPPLNLKELLFEVQLQGYVPILAHPERYFSYHSQFDAYLKLKQAGCLFQLNLLSLIGFYGLPSQKAALKILDKGLYDFAGTDAHKAEHLKLLKNIKKNSIIKKLKPLIENSKRFV
ncbi:MAG: histidinol phosphatase [Flavobacteriales bacterium CG_4_9_14_3_um_filter_40_17]|nr:MAG: histidinol phosphatase [Flavobacteriales bacterium CG_4_9_14_3_um_filter_40_17]